MTTVSPEEQEGAFRPIEPHQPDTQALEIAPSTPQQSWLQLIDDSEIWYDQKSSKANSGAGSETNQQVLEVQWDESDDFESSHPAVAGNDMEETSSTFINLTSVDHWAENRHCYQWATENEASEARTRIWKLSTPPALSLVDNLRSQKIATSTRARKTIRSNVSISWSDGSTSWENDHSLNEDQNLGTTDQSSRSPGIEISFAEMTWSEMRLRENQKFKAYQSYIPTLLRWCWTATDG